MDSRPRSEGGRRDWHDDNPATPAPGGHTLPASEDEDEALGRGGEEEGVGHPGTMPPPD